MKIIAPTQGEAAYARAVSAFSDLWKQICAEEITVAYEDDGTEDAVIIGSDAVNDALTDKMISGEISDFGIRYGTDDYCIRCFAENGRRLLILAGGRGRSTLYAVYDFFERVCGCHWFWDGDVIPTLERIPLDDMDIVESPRFEFRGTRYFAHRSLHRFQAEHWSFADWKRELDYLTKRRLNFFMLRIGMDDLWQRAFPDVCDYSIDPGGEGYNDRTPPWSLRHRGELRQKVLAYARELDLIQPEDCGTMSHWYSPAPDRFIEEVKPDFFPQADTRYSDPRVLAWDIRKSRNMDNYMKLTEAAVRDFNPGAEYFHTIGLGERNMMPDKASNNRLKKFTYRRIAQALRERYPNSKLFIAAWDFIGWWRGEDVAKLLAEFDPTRTIVLDYTGEMDDPDQSFLHWGMVGKFPWVFGLFHGYQPESALRGPYERSDERLRVAVEDPMCRGMVLWPELSHSDPLILEYLAQNAWDPLKMTIEEITARFCQRRYGSRADAMNALWQAALPMIKMGDWGGVTQRPESDPEAKKYTSTHAVTREMWTNMFDSFLWSVLEPYRTANFTYKADHGVSIHDHFAYKLEAHAAELADAANVLLAALPFADSDDAFIRRDVMDICRTTLGRYMNFLLMRIILIADTDNARASALRASFDKLMHLLGELLAHHEDYSMYASLKRLAVEAPVTENFEQTLKKNALARYCRSYVAEPARYLYPKECRVILDWICTEKSIRPDVDFHSVRKALTDEFMDLPLAEMQAPPAYGISEILTSAATVMKKITL